MPNHFHIGHEPLNFKQIANIEQRDTKLALSDRTKKRVKQCRQYLESVIEKDDRTIYGVNTGFGALCNTRISGSDLGELQHNLVLSHACGTGNEVPQSIVKLMLLLKIQGLALGHSGVRIEIVERLIQFYNHGILPVIYEQGSLGASGDLAPLAHLALPLIGEGEVFYQGERQPAQNVLKERGWEPLQLQAKEGLALLNGTQFMSAYGTWTMLRLLHMLKWVDMIAALSLDVYQCKLEPFDSLIHKVRRHKGQAETAEKIRQWLKDSELAQQSKKQVQDPYSFRCIPQVHGACKQTVDHAHQILLQEINAVTDNPNVFPEKEQILSGGNFHGENLALALDYLSIGLAELGSISERRTYKLLCGNRSLPEFLVSEPGVHSGLMITQYTAASLVSQNKQLCTPASVDSITSSKGQEDHVSMGANAATKQYRIVKNLERILAIEFFTATQALDFRHPNKTSPSLENLVGDYRQEVPFVKADRAYYQDIDKTIRFLRKVNLTI